MRRPTPAIPRPGTIDAEARVTSATDAISARPTAKPKRGRLTRSESPLPARRSRPGLLRIPRPLCAAATQGQQCLARRLRPREGTPVGPFPEPLAAHHATRQHIVDRHAIPAGSTGELALRQSPGGPELHVLVLAGDS